MATENENIANEFNSEESNCFRSKSIECFLLEDRVVVSTSESYDIGAFTELLKLDSEEEFEELVRSGSTGESSKASSDIEYFSSSDEQN